MEILRFLCTIEHDAPAEFHILPAHDTQKYQLHCIYIVFLTNVLDSFS
jgi:hypothetical protein